MALKGGTRFAVGFFDVFAAGCALVPESIGEVEDYDEKTGIVYLGDGSWGKIRNPQKLEKISYLAAASRDYHLSLHRIQGDERFHMALDEFGRIMDVCRSGQRTRGLVNVPGGE